MKSISTRLVTQPDHPVDTNLLDILHYVAASAEALNIDYFVAGALARDIILFHVFGKDTGRATRDIDLGILIDGWDKFDKLKASLVNCGKFTEIHKNPHRLIYQSATNVVGIPLDLLPFGGIQSDDETIAWPPSMAITMNVAGFTEAHACALLVRVNQTLTIPVASLASLAILKLIAWGDRHSETTKDAADFFLIARTYYDAGNIDRLYDTEHALLKEVDFDPELAGVMLLGKDASIVCGSNSKNIVFRILTNSQSKQLLIDHILRANLAFSDKTNAIKVEYVIDKFTKGFLLIEI